MSIRRFFAYPSAGCQLPDAASGWCRSYKRIAGYFTSSLFEVAGEALEHIPEVKIVCNVDIHPDDLKVAQLRESKMLGRWNERALEAEALLNRALSAAGRLPRQAWAGGAHSTGRHLRFCARQGGRDYLG
jgi:hypothetical protein